MSITKLIFKRCDGQTECFLVGLNGIGPSTSPLSGVRSNQLSYRPKPFIQSRFLLFKTSYDQSVWALES